MESSSGSSKPIRVLVVDDSFFMRKMIVEAIDASGTGLKVVETASDGLEALAKIKTSQPDVLTLDVEMPRLDGLATLARIMAEILCRWLCFPATQAREPRPP